MKKLILFSILLCSSVSLAQNTAASSFRKSLDELPVSVNFGFKNFKDLSETLTVYSPTTLMTNQYVPSGNGYLRTNTKNLALPLNGITADSFNPNSAIDMKTALGMGLVRTLFKL